MCVNLLQYDNWEDFVRDYKRDVFGSEFFEPSKFLFRGQQDAAWELISSFDRKFGKYDFLRREKIECEMLKLFKENVIRHIPGTNIENYSDTQIKNLAQHYGVPTRLLDWSNSPFIAAYFAYEVKYNNSDYVAIWVLRRDHDIWNTNIGVRIEEDILAENDRQKHQLGCFTIQNSAASSLNEFVLDCYNHGREVEGALYKILLPYSERKKVLLELNSMNINASTIWGGYEGCAKTAQMEFELSM